jgi:NADP-dependent 3-hydroxy acid dehydrogenase YdfG
VAGGTTFLINNAGSSTESSLLEGDLQQIRREMETHSFGTLAMTHAFASIIAAKGGGAMLNLARPALPSGGAPACAHGSLYLIPSCHTGGSHS